MQIFEYILGHTQNILATSKNVVRSLTCNDLKYPALNPAPLVPPSLSSPMPPFSMVSGVQAQEDGLEIKEHPPKCTSWLLGGMILMGRDSYFPRLSAASSLWTPLQAAISFLHWMGAKLSWFSPSLSHTPLLQKLSERPQGLAQAPGH
ncbi:hypothetical protein DSO57_1007708 [Entomophthora muscae]|uniref:Uncharacterized protein n=1 Tax=Entomophthora muscae TaxID=34485 RepID=A0ACC2SW62_9FUNG|nr:hypothetical protein DSO57_1007708 [Entomophthora muscae]